MKLKSNLKAPNFKLPSTDKNIFELNKIKKNIILFFLKHQGFQGNYSVSQFFVHQLTCH